MSKNPDTVFVRLSATTDSAIIQHHQQLASEESRTYRGSIPQGLSTGSSVAFVAGVGNSVFGSLVLEKKDDNSWTITHVFVEPQAREIGIGDALVIRALEYLRNENASWLSAQAQPGDRALKNLFERHGLVAQTIIVGKSLSGPSTGADASQ